MLSPDCLQVEASLADKLRGVGPESVSFSYPNPSAQRNTGGPKPEIGDKFIVFLRDAGANDIRLEDVISLTKPIRGCELSAALEPDFSVLTDGTAIEKVVKDRIAAKLLTPTPWKHYPDDRFRLEIPHGTAAYRAVSGGSSCFLIVPDDLLSIGKAHLSNQL